MTENHTRSGTITGGRSVRAIRKGEQLTWYAPVPPVSVGESYLMFLKRDSEGFYPFLGFNGFLKVAGDRLIMNGHVAYSISTSQMTATLETVDE